MKNNIFINKYVMACAISIVIALVGYISMSSLPVEQYPDIAPPTVSVNTSYSGADENTVMKSVIQPLEEAINGVTDMTYITSKASSNGDVEINVYFKQGTDADLAAVNVQNRVSGALALLPADVTKVGVKVEKRQNNILQIFAVKSADGKYDEDFVSNYVDINIKPRLMRITGVGNVLSLGNTYALRIWLKPDVMAQYDLTPNDIFAAIGGQSFVAAVGSLGEQSGNSYQYNMQYKGTLKTEDEFKDIVRSEPVLSHHIGLQPDTQGIRITQALYITHTSDTHQARLDVDINIVGDEVLVILVVGTSHSEDTQNIVLSLLHLYTHLIDISRQQGLCTGHAVLHIHRSHVGVGTLLEIDIDLHLTVRRCF